MEEKRLERLENKVDRVEETVVEIKTDLKHYNNKVETHLASDEGIISTIAPILAKLPQIVEIAEEYQFQKTLKEKKTQKYKSLSLRLGLIATTVGIIVGITKLF